MLLCVAKIKLLMIFLRNAQIVVDHNNAYWVPHVLIHSLMMKRVVLMISKFIYNVHPILFSTQKQEYAQHALWGCLLKVTCALLSVGMVYFCLIVRVFLPVHWIILKVDNIVYTKSSTLKYLKKIRHLFMKDW